MNSDPNFNAREERDADLRPQSTRSPLSGVMVLLVLALAGYFAWHLWQQQASPGRALTPPVAAPQPAVSDGEPPVPVQATSSEPTHLVEAIAPPSNDLPTLANSDALLREVLSGLMGSARWAQFMVPDEWVRRVVATVDNLPRGHAPPSRWPVQRTPGQLQMVGEGDLRTLAPDNGARYSAIVRLAESVDPVTAVRTYARLYPLFQQAYEDLGYPGRYFNDRLIASVDHLLAAPELTESITIRVVEVRGELPSERPWERYEFADPRLEALSAGQKLMLRIGTENAQRVKAVLRKWRAALSAQAPGAAAGEPAKR